jgi:chromosomal replication initiation ATPase DnaA
MIITEEHIPHLTGQLPTMRLGIDHLTDDEKINYILSETANILDMVPNDLPRIAEQVEYRMVCIYLLMKYTSKTLGELGKLFNKHHASVIHANRRAEELMIYDARFRMKVQQVKDRIL